MTKSDWRTKSMVDDLGGEGVGLATLEGAKANDLWVRLQWLCCEGIPVGSVVCVCCDGHGDVV